MSHGFDQPKSFLQRMMWHWKVDYYKKGF